MIRILTTALLSGLLLLTASAQPPLRSGLSVGVRPGPYAALVSVGAERGQLHCYICEAVDRPIVVIFARTLSDELGKLVRKIDRALPQHKDVEMRAWVTFLNENHTRFDPQLVAWGQKHAIRNIPLAVFEDVVGPPTYRLARAADVTVLLSVRQKVMANFAFRAGELDEQAIEEIVGTLPKLLAKK